VGGIVVRRYESSDAEACCRVVNSAVVDMDGLNDAARRHIVASNTPKQLGGDLASWVSFVAEVDGSGIVGVGALDGGEAKRVYVAPGTSGRGVGRALIETLEAEAARRGIDVVVLDASPSSVAFYETLGYAAHDGAGFSIGEAEFRFVKMSKALAVSGPIDSDKDS